MTAQPVHQLPDPRDPQVILAQLPERERDVFASQFRDVLLAAAGDSAPVGYKRLQDFLYGWAIRAKVVSRPGYDEEREQRLEETRRGDRQTVPFFEAIDAELTRQSS